MLKKSIMFIFSESDVNFCHQFSWRRTRLQGTCELLTLRVKRSVKKVASGVAAPLAGGVDGQGEGISPAPFALL